MVEYVCIKKYRDTSGNISLYELEGVGGQRVRLQSKDLKSKIKFGQVYVRNLKLTTDNRLIDSKQEKFVISRVRGAIESYDDLNRRSLRRDMSAYKQLRDRSDNMFYTSLVDKQNNRLGFIYIDEITNLVSQIHKLYDKVRVRSSKSVIKEEVYYTCSIEGANTTMVRTEQIIQGSKPKNYSEKMIENSYKATKFLNLILQGNYISESALLKTWEVLTKGACDNLDIKGNKYRSGMVKVGLYYPPEPEYLDGMMNSYFNFMYDKEDGVDVFIKASLLHYYLVFVHPFCDGNGRTTRLISTDYLIRSGYDKFKAVSLSKEIKRTVLDYQKAIQNSENCYNDVTFFVEYYLTVIRDTLEDIIYAIK